MVRKVFPEEFGMDIGCVDCMDVIGLGERYCRGRVEFDAGTGD